jgi:hypothetical protein
MKRVVIIVLTCVVALLLIRACSNAEADAVAIDPSYELPIPLVLDITRVVGKPMDEVSKVLGGAENIEEVVGFPCKLTPGCKKVLYRSGKYEVIFINGKADWLTINSPWLSMNDPILKSLGIAETIRPSFDNPGFVKRWNSVRDIHEISVVDNGSGRVDYVLVIVTNPH